MTDPASLERGYRRLLAWYLQPPSGRCPAGTPASRSRADDVERLRGECGRRLVDVRRHEAGRRETP